MNSWWQSLSSRERVLIGGGAALLGMITIVLGVFEPLHARHQRLQVQNVAESNVLIELQGLAQQATALRGTHQTSKPLEPGTTLLAVLNSAAAENQLDERIKRVVPNGEHEASIAFDKISFDQLVIWMLALREQYGIEVSRIVVDKAGAAGYVNANLTLTTAL
ncbi:MAG: type II secretion system protein M [Gammaproteobacteria bacterium]|nr:type II secretion system protein M [Gammaproteobacteria bacterium]